LFTVAKTGDIESERNRSPHTSEEASLGAVDDDFSASRRICIAWFDTLVKPPRDHLGGEVAQLGDALAGLLRATVVEGERSPVTISPPRARRSPA
jgi:hypothetical protein